ncbi:MAG: serine/threonine protein kinase, partial [Gammaproteobacteria bacterium]|nr:serine/threonine protein kinase [Gammaproteobacteria bacterium]
PRTQVYEAERERDGRRVVAKVFELGDESVEARVAHEFRLLQDLDVAGVVKAIDVERAGRQIVLILESVPGHNLAQLAGGQAMAVDEFLPRAISMAEVLGRIHGRRVIHRDIKPSNILVEDGSDRVVFADFGISVLFEDERWYVGDAELLEGTLPYISPEQTGRTKREVDFRSDLYSLGATFYEL